MKADKQIINAYLLVFIGALVLAGLLLVLALGWGGRLWFRCLSRIQDQFANILAIVQFLHGFSHIFNGPCRIDVSLDFAILPQAEHLLHMATHIFAAVLLVQQMTQIETGDALVLVEQFDWRHLVDLPPGTSDAEVALGFAGDHAGRSIQHVLAHWFQDAVATVAFFTAQAIQHHIDAIRRNLTHLVEVVRTTLQQMSNQASLLDGLMLVLRCNTKQGYIANILAQLSNGLTLINNKSK